MLFWEVFLYQFMREGESFGRVETDLTQVEIVIQLNEGVLHGGHFTFEDSILFKQF